jgi:intein/homing endonuclease
MVIKRVDAEAYPQLARGIKENYISSTSMGCFTPECRVLMEDGTYIPISEVQPGDRVITHLGRSQEVLNVQIRTKDEDLREIKYEGLGTSIIVTKNHPILTLKKFDTCACGCGKQLSQYKKGSHRDTNWKNKYRKRFLNGHFQNVWNSNTTTKTHTPQNKKLVQEARHYAGDDFVWIDAKDIQAGDVIVFPAEFKVSRRKQPTLAQAKLIGYFLAEGSFKKYDGIRKEVNFSFCYSSEKDTYVPEVIQLLKQCFGHNISIWTQHKYPKNDVITVCCHNKKVAKWFYQYCGEYATRKCLPKEFINWSPRIQKTIIGYFINGDGCTSTKMMRSKSGKITPYTSISINTSSQALAEQFHVSLSICGIWHTLHALYNHKSTELKLCAGLERWTETRNVKGRELTFNCKPSFVINVNQNYANKLYPFTHKNHKQLYTATTPFVGNNDILITGPYLCRKVQSSDIFMYSGPVYNLQVKQDNSYIVEGATVKNCQVKYSLCSVCHNLAETPDSYCEHIRERKTREITAKKQKCQYHKNGHEEQCPICGSTKKEVKTFDYQGKAFEHNYGIKFIEDSFVVNPACSECGVTEVIDPQDFLAKVADIARRLPKLLKIAAQTDVMCDDQKCIKVAGQQEIEQLNDALNSITSVSQSMLQQKDQIDLEFLSDLVTVLADLQSVTDELTQQGYGRLQSPGQTPETTSLETPGQAPTHSVAPVPSAGNIQSGSAGQVGTITAPQASKKQLNLQKASDSLLRKERMLTLQSDLNHAKEKLFNLEFCAKDKGKKISLPFATLEPSTQFMIKLTRNSV